MRITLHGAAGEVTGSCHLLDFGDKKILLDVGLIQGGHEDTLRNREEFDFNPHKIDAVVISHAHIDHLGRLPLLVKRGYSGPVYTHRATADLARIMLEDSASLAAADAERDNRRRLRAGEVADVEPLYSLGDVADALRLLQPLEYETPTEILPGLRLTLHDAGHILGSACVRLVGQTPKGERSLVFSGDIGPRGTPIMRDPAPIPGADLVLMECTYGDRLHRSRQSTIDELGEVFDVAAHERGNVLIPAFAVGRSQELLYWMAENYETWHLDRWQIYLDSPMAMKVTGVYGRNADLFDAPGRAAWSGDGHPFGLPNLRLVRSVQESQALNSHGGGCIIVAGSGMCNGGRIRHHLRHNLWRENAHVVFVGYQARGTLGRRLVDGAEFVDIYGERIRVRARRHTVGGLSAHADQDGLSQCVRRHPGPTARGPGARRRACPRGSSGSAAHSVRLRRARARRRRPFRCLTLQAAAARAVG
jgi:metallo-beta-lactamase family protein